VRILVSFAAALSVVMLTAGIGSAQPPSTGAPSEKKVEKPAAKKATQNVSGTVRSSSNDAVVVTGRDKGKDAEWTFAVEPTTNIRKGSKSITAGDLKAGDAVQIRFVERDGKALADSILVKAAKKEPVKKEPAKK
jgi:hypothetical protein